MRPVLAAITVNVLLCVAGTAMAQEAGQHAPGPGSLNQAGLAVIDYNSLFDHSRFGIRLVEEYRDAQLALIAENEFYSGQFEIEEVKLTELRRTLTDQQFFEHAEEFDSRVEERRRIQDNKQTVLDQWRRQQIAGFQNLAAQIIGRIAEVLGLRGVLPSNAVIWYDREIDITEMALVEVNRFLADGKGLQFYVPATRFAGIETTLGRSEDNLADAPAQ